MGIYEYKGYKLRVSEASDGNQNESYDKTIVIEEPDFNKHIVFEIEHNGKTQRVMIVSPYHTPVDSFVAPHRDGLFLMLYDTLCVFDPRKLEIVRKNTIDPLATMIAVYPFGEDYILHGELEIYRISGDLNVKWMFSGWEIFVRHQINETAFEMKEDRICLYDFSDNYYEIDYDGKVIVEQLSGKIM